MEAELKTCLLIPGIDALEDQRSRLLLLQNPSILACLKRAEAELHARKVPLDLFSFMADPNQDSASWFHHLAVATVPVHLALYESYVSRHGLPDVVLSCSLGDISRNVCVGVASLEACVWGIHLFAMRAAQVKTGAVFRVSTNIEFSEGDFAELSAHGVFVSVHQTPKQILVGGELSNLLKWKSSLETQPRRWKIIPMYPFPLHTSLMQPCADLMLDYSRTMDLRPPEVRVFSAISQGWLQTAGEFRDDLTLNISKTVRWSQSIVELSRRFPDMAFVNLGPIPTLTKLFQKTVQPRLRVSDFDYALA